MALPGGFVEQHETIFEAVLRELHEETAIELTRQQLRQSLVGHKVFDHPLRSQFGRVITCAHCFQLGSRQFPGIKAGDDARNALWVSISDLCSLEEQFHDDHFLILDHFLGLLG